MLLNLPDELLEFILLDCDPLPLLNISHRIDNILHNPFFIKKFFGTSFCEEIKKSKSIYHSNQIENTDRYLLLTNDIKRYSIFYMIQNLISHSKFEFAANLLNLPSLTNSLKKEDVNFHSLEWLRRVINEHNVKSCKNLVEKLIPLSPAKVIRKNLVKSLEYYLKDKTVSYAYLDFYIILDSCFLLEDKLPLYQICCLTEWCFFYLLENIKKQNEKRYEKYITWLRQTMDKPVNLEENKPVIYRFLWNKLTKEDEEYISYQIRYWEEFDNDPRNL